MGLRLGLGHEFAEACLQFLQACGVDADTRDLHLRQNVRQRHLQAREQRQHAPVLQQLPEVITKIQDRPRQTAELLGPTGGVRVQGQLIAGILGLEFPVEEPSHQVTQVEAALAGQREVGGQRGVHAHPRHGVAPSGECEQIPLHLVQGLGGALIGEPTSQRGIVLGTQRLQVQPGDRAVASGQAQTVEITRACTPAAVTAQRNFLSGVIGEPVGKGAGLEDLDDHLQRLRRHRDVLVEVVEQPFPEHTELQRVEHLMDALPVERRSGQVVHGDRQLQVAHEAVQLPVGEHL